MSTKGNEYCEARYREQQIRSLGKRAEKLGLQLVFLSLREYVGQGFWKVFGRLTNRSTYGNRADGAAKNRFLAEFLERDLGELSKPITPSLDDRRPSRFSSSSGGIVG
jgi:hypothetical protein